MTVKMSMNQHGKKKKKGLTFFVTLFQLYGSRLNSVTLWKIGDHTVLDPLSHEELWIIKFRGRYLF